MAYFPVTVVKSGAGATDLTVIPADTSPTTASPSVVVTVSPNSPTASIRVGSANLLAASGLGAADASTLRTVSATDDPTVLALGLPGTNTSTSGPNVSGTLAQVIRGFWSAFLNKSAFVRLTDGTFDVKVTAANNPAVAADSGLVVALSPNSNIVKVNQADLYIAGTPNQAAITNNILSAVAGADIDCINISGNGMSYSSAVVELVVTAGLTGGSVVFEASNSGFAGGSWNQIPYYRAENTTSSFQPSGGTFNLQAGTSTFYRLNIDHKFIRCRIISALIGGTVTAHTRLSQQSSAFQTISSLAGGVNPIGSVIAKAGGSPLDIGKLAGSAVGAGDACVSTALVRSDIIKDIQNTAARYIRAVGTKYGSVYTREETDSKLTYSATSTINATANSIALTITAPAARKITIRSINVVPTVITAYSAVGIQFEKTASAITGGTAVSIIPTIINNMPGATIPTVRRWTASPTLTTPSILNLEVVAATTNNMPQIIKWKGNNGEIVLGPAETFALRVIAITGTPNTFQYTIFFTDEPA